MYLRLFVVHTLDMLFNTYYYCHDSCFIFLNKTTHTRTYSPDIIPLTSISSFESRRDTPSPPFFNERYPTPPLLFPPTPFKDSPSPPPFIFNIPNNINIINNNNNNNNNKPIITKFKKIDKIETLDKESSKYSPEIIDMNTQNHEFDWDIILDN